MMVEELLHNLYAEAYTVRLRAEKLEEEESNLSPRHKLGTATRRAAIEKCWKQYDAIMVAIDVIEERAT